MGDMMPPVTEAWSQMELPPTYTANVTFIIKNYREMTEMCVHGQELKSKPFFLKGKTFQLGILPAGHSGQHWNDHTRWVFLHNLSTTKVRVKAELNVGGVNTDGSYMTIEPRGFTQKGVDLQKMKLTEEGSLEIKGTVTLADAGQAVAVGRDGT